MIPIIEVMRYGFGKNSTLGWISLLNDTGRERVCFSLEDERRHTKVAGETCIPVGTYPLKLRTEGGMHGRYTDRFGARHKGMLWLTDVPGFEYVYIHVGNREDQTEGCILTGTVPVVTADGEFQVGQSTDAYWQVYELVVPRIIAGERVQVHVTETQPWA